MPLLFDLFVGGLGLSSAASWRLSMVAAGALCVLVGVAYYFLTQDTPESDFRDLRAAGKLPPATSKGTFLVACGNPSVWLLAALYGACFGIELTVKNVAALYFADHFEALRQLDAVDAMKYAGMIAGLYGSMNLFARTLGGWIGDRCGNTWGTAGRVRWLFLSLFCEGLLLVLFSQTRSLTLAVPALVVFALFVQMSCGATFSVVPFVLPSALGSVAGIVGAGGNLAAVGAGFLFKSEGVAWPTAFLLLGAAVTACSFLTFAVKLPSTRDASTTPSEPVSRRVKATSPSAQPALRKF